LDIREGVELEMVLADIFRKLQYLLKRMVHFKDTSKLLIQQQQSSLLFPSKLG
jgi:hypothetical protein